MPDAVEKNIQSVQKIVREMQDTALLDAVERYIRGEMLPEERLFFEHVRNTNPDVDQLVVEHTLFLDQFAQYGETPVEDPAGRVHETLPNQARSSNRARHRSHPLEKIQTRDRRRRFHRRHHRPRDQRPRLPVVSQGQQGKARNLSGRIDNQAQNQAQ
jgi:hypothetical protein